MLLGLLKLSRPKQWTKNLFVFGGLFFSHELFLSKSMLNAVLTFVAFSLISSSVYVLNDIVDVEKDRLHPKKKNRPLAAGTVRIPAAAVYGIVLLGAALALAWQLGAAVLATLLFYFLMNVAYSFWLKHVVLLDVMIIALGFILRVLAGSYAIPIVPSAWLLLCTFLLALFLGLCKRRAELLVLQEGATSHRKILDDYNHDKLLDQLIGIISASTIMAYSMYTFSAPSGIEMMWTIPLVIYSIFRYLYLVYKRESGGEPANILLGDKPFMIGCLIWATSSFIIVYFL